MEAIQPIRGRVPFGRVGPLRPARAIGEPWQDGHGARSDDDREELGGAGRWVSPEVAERVRGLNQRARASRRARRVQDQRAEAEPNRRVASSRVQTRVRRRVYGDPPPPAPGARDFGGGTGLDAQLAYGDVSTALIRFGR